AYPENKRASYTTRVFSIKKEIPRNFPPAPSPPRASRSHIPIQPIESAAETEWRPGSGGVTKSSTTKNARRATRGAGRSANIVQAYRSFPPGNNRRRPARERERRRRPG